MSWLGSLSIYFAFYVAIVGVALGATAAITRSRRFLHAARFATYTVFGALTVACATLVLAFLTHDFSIQYVQGFSDESMPIFYLVGALWGGQAGSWLFWVWMSAMFTAVCVYINRERYQDFMPWVIAVSMFVITGLLVISVFVSDPFETYQIIDDPTEGEGLNPLLQTPKMILHPPFLLGGMASMIVPFAFAMSALLSGKLGNTWVEAARKWVLVPWLLLTIGNILGGMWAYEELGWGGYWAWDPVENASLLPWLTSTALIHSLLIQERRGMLKRWNIGLMIGTFLLTIFGTYLTRSGLIESIHSFAQGEVGAYYVGLLAVFGVFSLVLFIWRWKDMRAEQRLDSPASREAAFIFNNWMFLSMTVVVLFGTLWPRITEWFRGYEVAMGPPWFNRWMIPLGLVMLLMMGIGTIIAWRKANWKNFRRNFIVPIIASLVLTPTLLMTYWLTRGADLGVDPTQASYTYDLEIMGYGFSLTVSHAILAVGAVWMCIFVAATIIQEFYRGMSARRRGHDESWAQSFIRLCMKQKRRYGGYIVHLGVVFCFLAFAGNSLKIEKDIALEHGQSITIGDYTLTHQGLWIADDDTPLHEAVEMGAQPELLEDHRLQAEYLRLYVSRMSVQRGDRQLRDMSPGKAEFQATQEMPISEIDIRTTPMEDLYVALVDFNPQTQAASFKVFVSPFTWFFWFGGVIMVLGTLICLWPTRRSLHNLRPGSGGWGRAAVFGSLVAISFAPVVIWTAQSHSDWGNAQRYELIADADRSIVPSNVGPPPIEDPGDASPPDDDADEEAS